MFSGTQKKGLLIVVFIVLAAGLVFHLYERISPPPGGVIVKAKEEEKVLSSTDIYVHVYGAVNNPGVYKVPRGSRLFEVIGLAGGFSNNADTGALNLARKVEDGEKIHVPTFETARASGSSVGVPVSSKGEVKRESNLVNVNKASLEELERLPGIGKSIAQRIIEYREKNGPFREPSDLLKVKGIGEKKLEKIRGMITF